MTRLKNIEGTATYTSLCEQRCERDQFRCSTVARRRLLLWGVGEGAAYRAVLGGVPWKHCQFHLQQNALQYVPRRLMRKDVAEDIQTIFNALDRATAGACLARTVMKYADVASKLSAWMEENFQESLTVFDFPIKWGLRLHTTNGLERLSQEIKRRTRVIRIFPYEASCLELISVILMEIGEEYT
jgi:putative transposase